MTSARRVVVTGLGVVSPVGHNVPDFWAALLAAETGVAPIQNIPAERLNVKIAGEVKGFAPEKIIDPKKIPFLDRFAQLGLAASIEAVRDAALPITPDNATRVGCIIGTGVGGQGTIEEQHAPLVKETSNRVHPFTIPRLMANAGASHISMQHGTQGPCFAIASACASATHAIGTAFHMIRAGMLDAAITGGTEACITFGTLKGWEAMRVVAPDACRPFSRDRQGMVLGEGAGILVLEEYEAAKARGARLYAEIIGFGMGADAKDLTSPDQAGMERAMRAALADAAVTQADIQHVNAHGTGTRANDQTESAALAGVLGAQLEQVSVTANKSALGHSLGAAGGLETVALALTLQHQKIPPTLNFLGPDPACPLDIVQGAARTANITRALKNSFAFGGLNAVLVLQKIDA